MTPPVGARQATGSSPKIACSTSPGASTVAATRSIASRARSRLLTLTFDISQLPGPRNWATAGGSNGYRAALVRRQLTPALISLLPGTAGLPPCISFSTSQPELPPMPNCMARRGQGAGNRRGQGALMAVLVSRHAEPSAAADRGAGRLLGGGRSLSPRGC